MKLARHAVIAASAWTAATAVLAAPTAPAPGERLVSPLPAGFVVGYTADNGAQSIREEVPRGETVEAWTRMVTSQRFGGLVSRTSPAAFARMLVDRMGQSCPGAVASAVRELTIGGHRAARMRVDCPDSGGKPESFVLLAIAGAADMHVKQAAVRGIDAPRQLAWGDKLLDATILCGDRDRAPACR